MPIKTIIGRSEWGLILTVDPAVFDPRESYTIEQEVDGLTMRWENVRPQREEDGAVRLYLPISQH